ncbi:MAG: hypothetical protein QM535_01680 [Limnohabitans sp.]|nr:hypothetical protein [Limnohabitans sp.]
MSRKYKFDDITGAYFMSFATVYWIDVFTREAYFGCLIESLDYCRIDYKYSSARNYGNDD